MSASGTAPASATDTVLDVRGLTIDLPSRGDPVRIVHGIDLKVDRGKIHGIAGESGSGKTMTALALLGLLPPGATTSGTADFLGRDLLRLSQKEWRTTRGDQIGVVFQDPMTALHPMLSIERQLTEHVRRHLGLDRRDARDKAVELLRQVQLPDPLGSLRSYPHQFSGGMRQRIAIAVALACDPQLLIADEPTTALDVTVQAGVLRLLKELCETIGQAVVVVTHDLGVMSTVADDLSVFYAGRVVESGPTRQLLRTPRHPYTRGLLDSLPHPERPDAPLVPIGGAPATPASLPAGCALHPRCVWAEDRCRREVPPLIRLEDGRLSACPIDPLVGATTEPPEAAR
jgi:oligopeptide transport system ATP-binding protein